MLPGKHNYFILLFLKNILYTPLGVAAGVVQSSTLWGGNTSTRFADRV